MLKQILKIPRVISRATTTIRATILAKVGADDIVNPEREAAQRWRDRLLAPTVMERIELADDFSLLRVPAPGSFVGKTLGELDIRKKHKVQIVAIRRIVEDLDADGVKRSRQVVISVPMADSLIKPGDVLMMIAGDDAMKKFPTG